MTMDVMAQLPLWTAWLRASERSGTTVRLREYHVRRYLNGVPAETDPLDVAGHDVVVTGVGMKERVPDRHDGWW